MRDIYNQDTSQSQKAYSKAVSRYIGTDMPIGDLAKLPYALEEADGSTRGMLLTCVMEYIFLHSQSLALSEDAKEFKAFIDEFDLGPKSIQRINDRIEGTVMQFGAEYATLLSTEKIWTEQCNKLRL